MFIAYAYNNSSLTHHLGPLREGHEANQKVLRSTNFDFLQIRPAGQTVGNKF